MELFLVLQAFLEEFLPFHLIQFVYLLAILGRRAHPCKFSLKTLDLVCQILLSEVLLNTLLQFKGSQLGQFV